MFTRIGSSYIKNIQPAADPAQPENPVPASTAEPIQPAAPSPVDGGPDAFVAKKGFDSSTLLQSTLLASLKADLQPASPLSELKIQGSNLTDPGNAFAVRREHQNYIEADAIFDINRPPFEMVKGRTRPPIFVKGPYDVHEVDMNDVDQNSLGNCYLMASLAAVAKQNPDLIKNMIKDNDDGTYTVTFKYAGQEVPITVTADFPGGITGTNHAGPGDTAAYGKKEIWPLIIEKAYGEFTGRGYNMSGGFAADALTAITGAPTSLLHPFISGFAPGTAFDASFDSLKRDLDSGKPIVFGVGPIKVNGEEVKGPQDGMFGLVGSHAYTLNKLYRDEQGQEWVELFNPWGNTHPQRIPFDQAKYIFSMYVNGRL
jgi:hypothetical protein